MNERISAAEQGNLSVVVGFRAIMQGNVNEPADKSWTGRQLGPQCPAACAEPWGCRVLHCFLKGSHYT